MRMQLQRVAHWMRFWVLHTAGWVGYAIVYYLFMKIAWQEEMRIPWLLMLSNALGWLLTAGLRYLYWELPVERLTLGAIAGRVLVLSIVVAFVWEASFTGCAWMLQGYHVEFFKQTQVSLSSHLMSFFWESVLVMIWSSLYFGVKFWQAWTVQKERTEDANLLARNAQLQMLRYQLNPHFLFNALNSIRALVTENKEKAKEMVTELSEFLHYSLVNRNKTEVPLGKELEAIRHFFAIEKKRYEEKLQIAFDIHPGCEEYPVLTFLLQPLAENAVKFGMQTSPMPLRVKFKSWIEREELHLEISNTGAWVEPFDKAHVGNGTGLTNIRQRLANAYPEHHTFRIGEEDGKVVVNLILRHTHPPESSPAVGG